MDSGSSCPPGAEGVSVMEPLLLAEEAKLICVGDGSLNYRGLPASKSQTGGVRSSRYILGYYVFAQAALAGASVNIVLYTTRILHFQNITAVLIGTNFLGASYLTSFIGAIFADGYIGRYGTAGLFFTVFLLGLALLTISSSVPGLTPPRCSIGTESCTPASTGQTIFFFVSLVLIAVGYGGSEPCAITFGADQFDEGDPVELTCQSSFFNWQALAYSLGVLIATTFIVYVEDNYGYNIGFAICFFVAIASACCFFAGTPTYRFKKIQENPYARVARVISAAAYKWNVQVPDDDRLLCEEIDNKSIYQLTGKRKHTARFRFLDRAAVVTEDRKDGNDHTPWHLCTVNQVEEVKSLFNLIPIAFTTLVYCTVHIQIFTLFVTQGITMDQRLGNFLVPPASLLTFNTLASVFFTIAYELALMPVVRSLSSSGQGLKTMTRINLGLIMSVMAMLFASFVEWKRLMVVEKYNLFNEPRVPLSILWQIPQYVLVGLSEVFAYVGLTEFAYMESPDTLRGAGACFFLIFVAFGSFLSGLSITAVNLLTSKNGQPGWVADNPNRGHLDYFFLLLAVFSAINVLYTLGCVRMSKDAQETSANNEDQP